MKQTVQLIRRGDQLVLVIDPSILADLQIDEHTPLELIVENDQLVLSVLRYTDRQIKLNAAHKWINANYGEALTRLVD